MNHPQNQWNLYESNKNQKESLRESRNLEVIPELQICGAVGGISSMKKGKSALYFDGEMSDGKAKDWV